MTEMEKVEKLREKSNVSYAEAKRALEASNWDILDAMILLEDEGRVSSTEKITTTAYSTKSEQADSDSQDGNAQQSETLGQLVRRFFRWLGKLLHIGNTNDLVVEKNGNTTVSLPVTVFVLLVLFCFWVVVPLMIVGLFFGFRYSFRGANLGKDKINSAMHRATDVAEDIKEEFKNKADNTGK